MKNWITALHGLVITILLLAKIWAPSQYQTKIDDTVMALTASGFFMAKDFNQHSTTTEVTKATVEEIKANEKSV